MKKIITLLSILFAANAFAQLDTQGVVRASLDSVTHIDRIAFGSCNHQGLPQEMWLNILESDPDLWIWLGDNIYGDTKTARGLIDKYNQQLSRPNYRRFMARVPMIGVWDDHDYGQNNANVHNPIKKESQQLFYQFIGEPENSPRKNHEGIYYSYVFGKPGRQVKIILLDIRYFKEEESDTTDILGEAQWKWFEEELMNSTAEINIIATGTQFLSTKPTCETWTDFPASVKRMYDVIKRSQKPGIMFMSGDIHCGELMVNSSSYLNYPIYEFTSSGLTHAHWGPGIKKNAYKLKNPFCSLNYGLMTINWKEPVSVKVEIKDIQNFTAQEVTIYLDDLKVKTQED